MPVISGIAHRTGCSASCGARRTAPKAEKAVYTEIPAPISALMCSRSQAVGPGSRRARNQPLVATVAKPIVEIPTINHSPLSQPCHAQFTAATSSSACSERLKGVRLARCRRRFRTARSPYQTRFTVSTPRYNIIQPKTPLISTRSRRPGCVSAGASRVTVAMQMASEPVSNSARTKMRPHFTWNGLPFFASTGAQNATRPTAPVVMWQATRKLNRMYTVPSRSPDCRGSGVPLQRATDREDRY